MKTLFVNACVRPQSRTMVLAQHTLDKIGGDIDEIRLDAENIQPLDLERMEQRDKAIQDKDSNADILKYARQFAEADNIVIAAPFWDLSFPAMVKNYIEAITVQGITFYYNEKGIPQGLCKAKQLIYVMTAGGPVEGFNFGFDYIKGLSQMLYGIQDVKCFKAEMLDVWGMDVDDILKEAMMKIDEALA